MTRGLANAALVVLTDSGSGLTLSPALRARLLDPWRSAQTEHTPARRHAA